jgi:hypothetical protein
MFINNKPLTNSMVVGRIFGDLSVFDLLGNFIPGLIILMSISLIFPSTAVSMVYNGGLVIIFLLSVIAFVLGHLIQSYASQAVGTRETFRNSILIHQTIGTSSVLDFDENPTAHPQLYCIYKCLHPDEPEEWDRDEILNNTSQEDEDDSLEPVMDTTTIIGRLGRVPARLYRSVIEALLMIRIKRDRPLSDVTLAGKAWSICRKKYELDRQYDQYGDLLHLISSDIESHSIRSRALRFQAIRNLYRGLWISFYLSSILMLSILVAQLASGTFIPLFRTFGIPIWEPVIVDLQIPVWFLLFTFLILMYLFWELKEDFEEEFVEYLLSDFLSIYSEIEDHDQTPEWKQREVPDWYR